MDVQADFCAIWQNSIFQFPQSVRLLGGMGKGENFLVGNGTRDQATKAAQIPGHHEWWNSNITISLFRKPNVAFQAKPFLEVFNFYFCPNCSSANTFEGEKCRTHGSLRPAQVVLRLDQQVHQRKTLRLTNPNHCLYLKFIYKQKLVINSNWHHEPLYNNNNERWMLGCRVHTQ